MDMTEMIAKDFAEDDTSAAKDEKNIKNEETELTEDAEKHQKFLDSTLVAVRKTSQAIEKIGKFSNRKQFVYSKEEADRIFDALQEVLDDTKKMFSQRQEFSW